jgi:hypothetical protein
MIPQPPAEPHAVPARMTLDKQVHGALKEASKG